MYPSKITILKGKTVEDPKGKWKKVEILLELTLSEKDDVELAKEYADTLLSAWLNSKPRGNARSPLKQANPENKGKKICKFEGCSKEIDARYSFCFIHFKRVTGR